MVFKFVLFLLVVVAIFGLVVFFKNKANNQYNRGG